MHGRGRPAIRCMAMGGILAAAGVGFCEAGRGRFGQQDERVGNLHLYVYRPSPYAVSTWRVRCRQAALCTAKRWRARCPGYPPPQPLLRWPQRCEPDQTRVLLITN